MIFPLHEFLIKTFRLSYECIASKYVIATARFLSLSKEPKVGGLYIDFEQENSEGKKIKLSDIRGTYTLIEFWASWCGPCRKSNTDLVKTYQKYKDQGFEIIGVSLDINKKYWVKAIEKDGLPWENVSDLNGDENEVALMYGINKVPDNFLIDEKGIIVDRDLRNDELKKKLAEVMGEKENL